MKEREDYNRKFDMLDEAIINKLDKNGKINYMDIGKMVLHDNVLIQAPASAGKTYATIRHIIKLSHATGVLLVPTTYLVKDLEKEYRQTEFSDQMLFLYGKDAGCTDIYEDGKKLYVMTYDQFQNYEQRLKKAHLYIDEAHEFFGYCAIDTGKMKICMDIFQNNNKKAYITATPLNLHKYDFSKIYVYKGDISDMEVILSESYGSCANDTIDRIMKEVQNGQKVLVYLNWEVEAKKMQTKLDKIGITSLFMKSAPARNGEYDEIFNIIEANKAANERVMEIPYNVVIVTKFLNTGANIIKCFDTSIYTNPGHNGIDMCAAMQFIRRERFTKKFIVCFNHQPYETYEINTKIARPNIKDTLTKEEKDFYNYYIYNEEVINSLYTSKMLYGSNMSSKETFEAVIDDFYAKYNLTVEEGSRKEDEKFAKKSLIEKLNDNEHDLVEVFKLWTTNSAGYVLDNYSTKEVKRLLTIFASLKNAGVDADNIKNDITNQDFFKISTKKAALKALGPSTKEIIEKVEVIEAIEPTEIKVLCKELNDRGLIHNEKEWKVTNFKQHMEHYELYFESITRGKKACIKYGLEYDSQLRNKQILINTTLSASDFIMALN